MLLNSKYLNKKKVFDLIHDDYHYAKVLNSFGIDFYKHYDENLNDLCESKGISFGKLLGYRNSLHESSSLAHEYLKSSAINLVIEFLKDKLAKFKIPVHFWWINKSLPRGATDKLDRLLTIKLLTSTPFIIFIFSSIINFSNPLII